VCYAVAWLGEIGRGVARALSAGGAQRRKGRQKRLRGAVAESTRRGSGACASALSVEGRRAEAFVQCACQETAEHAFVACLRRQRQAVRVMASNRAACSW